MPTYELICTDCETEDERFMSISTYENTEHTCSKCGGHMTRHYRSASNFMIPANSTYNGITKISNASGKKQSSRVPINIIDEKPDGGYSVTRIGDKKDIHND